jgi:hypothetical protein
MSVQNILLKVSLSKYLLKLKTSVKNMSNEKLIGKAVSKGLRGSFMKWFTIGLGAAIVIGSVVGVSVYFTLPDGGTNEPPGSYTSRLASEIQGLIPDVVYMEISGNASQVIDDRMIWSEFERVGTSEDYYWNTTAQLMFPDEEINFDITKEQVEGIAQAFFDSISATERLGTWGEDPYDGLGDLPNMKWVTELYLDNGTAIFLYVNMESLVLFQSTTWTGNFEANMNMMGAAVLSPESAFNTYVDAMSALFEPHT